MKLPRDLSGAELIKLLGKHFGYRRVNQEGSHVILETSEPRQHRISIPDHAPLRIGTLNSILRAIAAAKGVEKEDILRHL
jgi:predicted RNA binding protein YcfA (HicA-like mRNA interferase family)